MIRWKRESKTHNYKDPQNTVEMNIRNYSFDTQVDVFIDQLHHQHFYRTNTFRAKPLVCELIVGR